MLKGDALVTYLKLPSVDLACQILDGGLFRHTMVAPMSVTPAKFEMKPGKEFVPKAAKSRPKNSKKQQLQKLERRLAWGGFDDRLPAGEATGAGQQRRWSP